MSPGAIGALELLDALIGRGLTLDDAACFLATEFSSDGVIILVPTDDLSVLVSAAAYPPHPAAQTALRLPYGSGVAGLVASGGHAITLVDDSPRTPALRELFGLAPGQTASRMCVPCHGLGADVVGVISWHRRTGAPYDDADLARARISGDLVGLRLQAERLIDDVDHHRSERDTLMAAAVSAQESERRRIAGDLHDGVSQALVSLGYHLSAAEASLDSLPDAAAALREVRAASALSQVAFEETRSAIAGLHSLVLEDLGLVAALTSLAQSVPQLDVEFRHRDDEDLDDVPDHVAAALYRIAQEAIQNAVKHSEATKVVLSLGRASDRLVLGVTDDGVGFDVRAHHASGPEGGRDPEGTRGFGLGSIAERCALVGARLRIESIAGRGTAVIVDLPL